MSILKPVAISGLLLIGSNWLIQAALAQPITSSTSSGIDPTPIIVALINLAFPAVAAVATYLINHHVKNQQMATLLSNAVQNGVGYIQQQTIKGLPKDKLEIQAPNPDIAAGVQYVLNNASEAITHFNIPTDRISQKLEAKLGLAEIATNLATTGAPAPILAGPLAPVPTGRIELPKSA
jgi:hypothetical protein